MSAPQVEQPEIEAAPTGLPEKADDLRGYHFSRLMRTPLTLILLAGLVLIGGTAGALLAGAVAGAAAGAVALLVGIGIVFALADRRAADDFFEVYATERGLTLVHGRGRLPEATPLLRKGDDRYTERSMVGRLGEWCDGTLALYTYEDETTDGEGNTQTNHYRYTLGLVDVPECVQRVPELYCRRKSGLRALERLEDAFRTGEERVRLESGALDEKYEIFTAKGQDENWLRQLFSPTFILWLSEAAPPRFAFELVGGALCCYVNGHEEDAAALDAIAAATGEVAKRLREEALE